MEYLQSVQFIYKNFVSFEENSIRGVFLENEILKELEHWSQILGGGEPRFHFLQQVMTHSFSVYSERFYRKVEMSNLASILFI